MKHLMVDLATLLVCSCSIYVSLDVFGVCGSSKAAMKQVHLLLLCYSNSAIHVLMFLVSELGNSQHQQTSQCEL